MPSDPLHRSLPTTSATIQSKHLFHSLSNLHFHIYFLSPLYSPTLSLPLSLELTKMGILSRKATCNTHGQDSSYFLGWEAYEKNPYHEVKNPNGIIQMGLAENQVTS